MLQAASQVANSITHLKSKYMKYLEELCFANGIDISTLKSLGCQYNQLEMYFGGLPVLIGLKYFDNLHTLRIFGQNLTSLKPLSEVAGTLEELWVCEGILKDISGIEQCLKLKRVYLYENAIEDCSTLTALSLLETVQLEGNRISSLQFLESLPHLTSVNLASNQMRDSVLCSISSWPKRLQSLNLTGNSFQSLKALFPLCVCVSLRHLSLFSPSDLPASPRINEHFLGWVAYNFRFIESIDDDDVFEQFTTNYQPLTEARLAECMDDLAKLEDKLHKDTKMAEKHATRVEGRLSKLCDGLEKLKETLPSKDGKREVVKRVLEMTHSNLKAIKLTKKNLLCLSRYSTSISRFLISLELEASSIHSLRDPTEEEQSILTHFLNSNCSMKHNYEITIKHCVVMNEVQRSDAARFCLIPKNDQTRIFTETCILDLLDHHLWEEYRSTTIGVYKDIEAMKKEAKEKTTIFMFPIMINRAARRPSRNLCLPVNPETSNDELSARSEEERPLLTSDDKTSWTDLDLVAVVSVELRWPGHIHTDHLRSNELFDESFEEQLKKLREMGIHVDLKEDKVRPVTEDVSEPIMDSLSNKTSAKRLKDMLTVSGLKDRWSDSPGYGGCLTIRNPVEIIKAYSRPGQINDTNEFLLRITSLDLSSMKLTKMSGIEALENLMFLDLKKNKLTALKKISNMFNLRFLDASHNCISKLDHLPPSLTEVNLSQNRLCSLNFCASLQILERLNANRNHIKSLKGIENCKLLETLMLTDNQIKEKSDIDLLKACSKLWCLDFTGNVVTSLDGYRSKLHFYLPYLLSLDRNPVLLEERSLAHKRTGRGLTIELMEKCFPDLADVTSILLADHKLEVIVMDRSSIDRLSHITHIDLSSNQLQQVKELAELPLLKKLFLAGNNIRAVCAPATTGQESETLFPSLEVLDLSSNDLSHTILPRLGLQYILSLKELNLSENIIARMDSSLFDLPALTSLDLSSNQIKNIRRKVLPELLELNLEGNKLKELDGLIAPNLKILKIANNKIATCNGLKPIHEMTQLESLDCVGNTVVGRRVYFDFVKTQAPNLIDLDGKPIGEHTGLPEVRFTKSTAKDSDTDVHMNIAATRRQSLNATSFSLPSEFRRPSGSWGVIEGTQLSLSPVRHPSPLLDTASCVIVSEPSFERSPRSSNDSFILVGTKVVKHRKPD